MTKLEFVNELKTYLAVYMSADEVEQQVLYYEKYIMDQVDLGRTESDVLEELGDPRLLAKNLVDTSKTADEFKYSYKFSEYSADTGKPSHLENVKDEGMGISLATKIKWILIAVLIIALLIVLLVFAVRLFIVALPVIAVLTLIGFIVKKRK